MNPIHTRRWPALAGIALMALQGGCGGADADADADAARAARLLGATVVTSPLFDDNGLLFPAPSEAVPADAAVHTRSGHYATPAQAEQLEHALGPLVIAVIVEPGPDAAAAADQAAEAVIGRQAASALSFDAPVLVRSPDLRMASAAAQKLEAIGFSHVFLVNH